MAKKKVSWHRGIKDPHCQQCGHKLSRHAAPGVHEGKRVCTALTATAQDSIDPVLCFCDDFESKDDWADLVRKSE